MKKQKNDKKQKANNDYESEILRKSNMKFIYSIGIAASIILTIIVISCILSIYNFFKDINIYLGIGILVLIIILLIIFIIRPIVIALSAPCFTLDINSDKDLKKIGKRNYKKLVKVAKNIIKTNTNLSKERKLEIENNLNNKKELPNILKNIYDNEIKKDINGLITKSSTEVLLATAISQNNKFDTLTTIIINIRLIMQIVVRCGYRPSYAQLSKLIVKVLRNALIAYTLQTFNLEDIIVDGINKLVQGTLSIIPGLNVVTKSLTQGAANALLTLRIGYLTRKYLYEEYNVQTNINNLDETNNQILMDAIKEANDNIDSVIKECKNNKKQKVTA